MTNARDRQRWLHETRQLGIPLEAAIAVAPLMLHGRGPCAWPECRFTPAWLVHVDGREDRVACTTHLGFVCADGNPHDQVGVRLLAHVPLDRTVDVDELNRTDDDGLLGYGPPPR